jgi:hypothetical protein
LESFRFCWSRLPVRKAEGQGSTIPRCGSATVLSWRYRICGTSGPSAQGVIMPPTSVGARRQGGTHWADLGSSRAAAGFRTSGLNHAVENSDADGSLDLLAGQLQACRWSQRMRLYLAIPLFHFDPLAAVGLLPPSQVPLSAMVWIWFRGDVHVFLWNPVTDLPAARACGRPLQTDHWHKAARRLPGRLQSCSHLRHPT